MPKSKEETREQILAAASDRILKYGFNKTTMNEIAKDCNMSAANIYRFFKNKNDIAAALALESFHEAETLLKALARESQKAPVEKLKAFTIAQVRMNYEMFNEQPNCFEVVNYIMAEREDLIMPHADRITSFLAEILAEGNQAGIFDIDDIFTMADTFLKAVKMFLCPAFIHMYSLEEMEESAERVIDLLVRGLEKR